MSTQSPLLEVQGLQKSYGGRKVVDEVGLRVNPGEIVGLLGPNGAGKTTTFYMITGMVNPSSGGVYLGDRNITNMPMYKRAQIGVGYLSQEPSVFTKLSVEDNLKLVLELTNYSKSEQSNVLEKLLDDFSIGHIRKSMSMTLSGGERRRTEIARALIMNPDFILLDEPFSGIDPIAVEDIQEIIRTLKKQSIGILITDHNVRETLDITDRAYLLYEGKILKEGTAEDLMSDKDALRLYLGSTFK